jgi:DNA-3-methyladenine glycosylase
VYFSYGMHWCANVVTGQPGTASAVLLRAGRVVEGIELARLRRGPRVKDRALARGPACLTRALGIDRSCNGAALLTGGELSLGPAPQPDPLSRGAVAAGPRVGVSLAHELPLRFWVDGDRTVSAYKRSPRAPAPGADGAVD